MAEIHQVLWSLAVHAAEHHDAQLVGDSHRYIEPVQLGVQEPRQAMVKHFVPLVTRAAVFNTCCNLSVITFGTPARTALQ